MFETSFTEFLLIFVIALVILGPERLPKVAAQLGRWVGKARRTAMELRRQLEREVNLNEITRPQPPPRPPAKPLPERPAGETAPEPSASSPVSASPTDAPASPTIAPPERIAAAAEPAASEPKPDEPAAESTPEQAADLAAEHGVSKVSNG